MNVIIEIVIIVLELSGWIEIELNPLFSSNWDFKRGCFYKH